MIVCILGLSASGKDYMCQDVSKKYKLSRILQYATRPIRDNEIDGVDYHFINEMSFLTLINDNAFVSYRSFNSCSGRWYYGIKKKNLEASKNSIVCIDIEGLEEMLKEYGRENIISIFIEADYEIRKFRAENRSDFNISEFNRRYKDDLNKIDKIKAQCEYVVENNHSNMSSIATLYSILEARLDLSES